MRSDQDWTITLEHVVRSSSPSNLCQSADVMSTTAQKASSSMDSPPVQPLPVPPAAAEPLNYIAAACQGCQDKKQ
eukprot:s2083_g1.t1